MFYINGKDPDLKNDKNKETIEQTEDFLEAVALLKEYKRALGVKWDLKISHRACKNWKVKS